MTRALCLWLPHWSIQRLFNVRRELKQRAVVLYRPRRGGNEIVACSRRAREGGIYPGMPLAEAVALSLAGLHVEEHDPSADRKALEELACWCEPFSPYVGLEEGECPESLLLDVRGIGPLFHGEAALCEQVVRALRRRGLQARVAIAETCGAAWAVAHYAAHLPMVVSEAQTLTTLSSLPVDGLRLSAATTQSLLELGILQIGQLLALPRASFASRFEPELLQRLDQATGRREEKIAAQHSLPEIAIEEQFEHPIRRRDEVELVLSQWIERIAVSLQARQQGALRLECRIDLQSQASLGLQIGLYQATAVPQHLRQLLLARLERVALSASVTGLQLAVPLTAPLQYLQQELFAQTSNHDDRRQLALLIDRLSSGLERSAVVRPWLVADSQPEFAYRYEPLTGMPPRMRSRKSLKSVVALPPLRPLQLQAAPRAVHVVSVMPHGPPIQFCWQDQLLRIERAWGPERIYTGWWRGRSIHRDYYCVETAEARRFWLFRRVSDGRWFLHGTFD